MPDLLTEATAFAKRKAGRADMTDPTFETRAELEAWATAHARAIAREPLRNSLNALATIRRVTLAHSHLLADNPGDGQTKRSD